MRILYDSRDTQYKTPFGTIRTGQCCVMHIHVPKSSGATGVRLMLEDCDYHPTGEYPFTLEGSNRYYDIYRCDFSTQHNGLYFYWFYVTKAEGGFRLLRQGRDTNMEAGDKWQLSVIPEDFTTPDFAKGAVLYQILPDRFYKSGDCDLTEKLQPFTVHENWEDTPSFHPDEEGNWCGDFFGGNLRGIQEKLPYLKSLGVGVIYCNPVFMCYSNHRYDTADYKRIDPMLGTEEDFKNLCTAAHDLGIRIILDGVFSHTGSNSIYFDAKNHFGNGAVSNPDSPYRDWYHFYDYPQGYDCWWNMPTLPNVDELNPGYIQYIVEDEDSVVAHWLRLGADGFRLDVADELPDEFILRMKKRIREINPQAMLLGEVWEDASNKRAYSVSRRYFVDGELDSVMNYPWRNAVVRFVMGEDDGRELGETIMTLAENYPPQVLTCVMNLLGTHDTLRILTALGGDPGGDKEDRAVRRMSPVNRKKAMERLRMAAFLEFMLPGMASIYYGDEAGCEGYEDPFCRRTYPWGKEDQTLIEFFRSLAAVKNESEALRYGDIYVTEAGKGKISFVRRSEGEIAEIFVNQSEKEWAIPNGKVIFGRGLSYNGKISMLLPKGFCVILRNP